MCQEETKDLVELSSVLHSYGLSLLAEHLFQIFVVSRVPEYRDACKWVSYGNQ